MSNIMQHLIATGPYVTATTTLFGAIGAAVLTHWLEARKSNPALTVTITECEYSESSEKFGGSIVIENLGNAVADQVCFRIPFGGSNHVEDIGPLVIQPGSSDKRSFSYRMTPQAHKIGQTKGNLLNALIEGSYRGSGGRRYRYQERHDYDQKLSKFACIWAASPATPNRLRMSLLSLFAVATGLAG